MSQLRLPAEGEDGLDLLLDHLGHRVPAVHIDRADAHNLGRKANSRDTLQMLITLKAKELEEIKSHFEDGYHHHMGCHPPRKVQFFLTLFKRPLTPLPPLPFEQC